MPFLSIASINLFQAESLELLRFIELTLHTLDVLICTTISVQKKKTPGKRID